MHCVCFTLHIPTYYVFIFLHVHLPNSVAVWKPASSPGTSNQRNEIRNEIRTNVYNYMYTYVLAHILTIIKLSRHIASQPCSFSHYYQCQTTFFLSPSMDINFSPMSCLPGFIIRWTNCPSPGKMVPYNSPHAHHQPQYSGICR